MANYQEEVVDKLQIMGNGDSKEHAFADALSKIAKQVTQHNQVTVQITPQEIEVVTAEKRVYTEHFLWFFLPRQRENFSVNLKISVLIKYIDINQINFIEKNIKDPNGILLPKFKLKS